MSPFIVIAVLLLGFLLWWAGRWLYFRHFGRKLLSAPLPEEAIAVLRRRVPLYNRLPAEQQLEMQGCINRFLFSMAFVGCDGFEIDDEVRLTVAGNACLLILNRERKFFCRHERMGNV